MGCVHDSLGCVFDSSVHFGKFVVVLVVTLVLMMIFIVVLSSDQIAVVHTFVLDDTVSGLIGMNGVPAHSVVRTLSKFERRVKGSRVGS